MGDLQYTVEARLVRHGLARASRREASIQFDTSAGQSDTHMGPADLLATAFAACVRMKFNKLTMPAPTQAQLDLALLHTT
jgi:uncharacterized OsmC-like protein